MFAGPLKVRLCNYGLTYVYGLSSLIQDAWYFSDLDEICLKRACVHQVNYFFTNKCNEIVDFFKNISHSIYVNIYILIKKNVRIVFVCPIKIRKRTEGLFHVYGLR